MRIDYSDDETWPGQFELWQANCRRSLKGKIGQQELRELEAALIAMPEKQLIHGRLYDGEGGMCAIACYAKHKGVDLSKYDPECDSDDVGIDAGMPRLVAWKVVELNDVILDGEWLGEGYKGFTPEERYARVLAWVQAELVKSEIKQAD